MTVPNEWGLPCLPGATFHWNARAIYNGSSVDLLWDRQAIDGAFTEEEKKALVEWLNKRALPLLHALARDYQLPRASEKETIEIAGDGYRLRADPRASYGYLYLSASPDATATGETPKPKPPPRAKKTSKLRRAPGRY